MIVCTTSAGGKGDYVSLGEPRIHANVSKAQVLSHLRLLNLRFGLLINFHEERPVDGVSRIVNGYGSDYCNLQNTEAQRTQSPPSRFFSVISVPLCFKTSPAEYGYVHETRIVYASFAGAKGDYVSLREPRMNTNTHESGKLL